MQRVGKARKTEAVERIREAQFAIDLLSPGEGLYGGVISRNRNQGLAEERRRKGVSPVGYSAVVLAGVHRDVGESIGSRGRLAVGAGSRGLIRRQMRLPE